MSAEIIEVDPLSQADSVLMLENILGAERVHAEIDSAHEIIELLGGLPLALDIVAGYLSEVDDLLIAEYKSALLDERQRLESLADWEDTSKDVVASFELSYNKLPPNLQKVFAGLSIFHGRDFSPEAASNIFSMPLPIAKSTLGRMKSLSLLTTTTSDEQDSNFDSIQGGVEPVRYYLHPLLKLFASSKLSEEQGQLHQRMLDYYVQLIEESKQSNYTMLAREWENISGVLQWAVRNAKWEQFLEGALGLTEPTVGIMGYLDAQGHWSDAAEMLELALQQINEDTSAVSHVKFLLRAGVYDLRQGDFERSKERFSDVQKIIKKALDGVEPEEEEALEIARNSTYMYESMSRIAGRSDREEALDWLTRGIDTLKAVSEAHLAPELGYLHIQMSSILGRLGRIDHADEAAKRGLEMLPATPSPAKVGGLINLAQIASRRGNTIQCIDYIEEGIKLATTIGEFRRLALLWMNLGAEQDQLGQYKDARDSYDTALHLYQKMGHEDEGFVHSNLGLTYTLLGQAEHAFSHLTNAIEFAERLNIKELTCYAKTNLARLLIYEDSLPAAIDNLAHAKEICDTLQLTYQFIEIRRLQAEAALRSNALEDSSHMIAESIERATDMDQSLAAGICWRVKGDILKASAAVDDAQAAYKTSLALIDDLDPYEQARTKVAMARLYIEEPTSTTTRAKKLLNEALDTFEYLGTQREILAVDKLLNELDFRK